MPVADPTSGRIFIWITACFLFICVIAGGVCLAAYMILPESQVPYWTPELGITLVCLPWAFWFLTCIYQIFSRCFGCRLGFGSFDVGREGLGDRGDGDNGANARAGESVKANNNNCLDRTLSVASHESQMPLANSIHS